MWIIQLQACRYNYKHVLNKRSIYSWKEDPSQQYISRSFHSIGSSDAYYSSSRSGQLFKRDAEIRDRNAAKGGNGVVNGEIVDKTRSLLTGTESKAEERQRAAREEIERDIGPNSEDGRTKGERDEGKKEHTFATRWAGRDACVRSHTDGIPCFHAYTAIFSYSLPSCSSSSPRSLLFSLLLSKFRFHFFFHTFFVLFCLLFPCLDPSFLFFLKIFYYIKY